MGPRVRCRVTAGLWMELEPSGVMWTLNTLPARILFLPRGSPTTPGPMRPVPLQLPQSTPPTLLPPLTTTLSLITLNLLLWEVPTSSTTSSMVDMIQSPLETSDKEMLPARSTSHQPNNQWNRKCINMK